MNSSSRLAGSALALILSACAGGPTQSPPAPITSSSDKPSAAEMAVGQAVTSPLSDLNLVQAAIPVVLREAHKSPYGSPADTSCEQLAQQVKALDEVLGTDLDEPPTPSNPGLVERGSKEVGHAAAGALKSAAEGIVPFRGWVRKLSGAERYSKEVAAAIAAGTVRRAYLKGLGEARGCAAPAAPQHHEPKA
jgi:hypothetical protein